MIDRRIVDLVLALYGLVVVGLGFLKTLFPPFPKLGDPFRRHLREDLAHLLDEGIDCILQDDQFLIVLLPLGGEQVVQPVDQPWQDVARVA